MGVTIPSPSSSLSPSQGEIGDRAFGGDELIIICGPPTLILAARAECTDAVSEYWVELKEGARERAAEGGGSIGGRRMLLS